MCPDTELLSAYYDHELDKAWETRVGDHVAGCSVCQAKLSRFARLTEELTTLEEPDFESSMARSWLIVGDARRPLRVPFWTRKVSVPMPLIAAAAAVLVAVFGLGIYFNIAGGQRQQSQTVPVAMQQTDITPVDFQVNNLNDLLSYLNSKDLGTSIVIQLPKGVEQLSVGKPQLIRAADFNRGQ